MAGKEWKERFAWFKAIRDNQKYTPAMRAVAWALWSHADDDGVAWPSLSTLCAEAGLSFNSRSHCQTLLRVLQSGRLLRIQARTRGNGSQTSSCYQLILPGIECVSQAPGGVSPSTQGVSPTAPPEETTEETTEQNTDSRSAPPPVPEDQDQNRESRSSDLRSANRDRFNVDSAVERKPESRRSQPDQPAVRYEWTDREAALTLLIRLAPATLNVIVSREIASCLARTLQRSGRRHIKDLEKYATAAFCKDPVRWRAICTVAYDHGGYIPDGSSGTEDYTGLLNDSSPIEWYVSDPETLNPDICIDLSTWDEDAA